MPQDRQMAKYTLWYLHTMEYYGAIDKMPSKVLERPTRKEFQDARLSEQKSQNGII